MGDVVWCDRHFVDFEAAELWDSGDGGEVDGAVGEAKRECGETLEIAERCEVAGTEVEEQETFELFAGFDSGERFHAAAAEAGGVEALPGVPAFHVGHLKVDDAGDFEIRALAQ